MINKIYFPLLLLMLFCSVGLSQLQSPDAFLPHNVGEQFTPHYMQVDYMYHVAENSPNVQIVKYGMTNQKRPLLLLYISTPENLEQLDAIRENNLKRCGLMEGDVDPSLDRALVWMSYNVHGNEAAAAESALPTVYALANPNNTETQEWLKNTIVIIDPCLNPDGYNRYTHWYRNNAQLYANPSQSSLEHQEPWPGGRVNHYLFDLNRDWAWQTQVESQARLKKYHEWMPHVHADFHEQGYNSPYYFAPAARPYHEYITDWQRSFQEEVGKNHAKYFDANNWLYFTKQVFDLLYPSYGDTYPLYNGAIGMTYEQGGGSRAGRAIIMDNGDTLTLKDRVDHHYITSISTVEVSSNNADGLLENFTSFYENNIKNPQGPYKTYIIKGNNSEGRLKRLCELLDKNQIVYGKAKSTKSLNAYDYQNDDEKRISISDDDLLISAHQPKGMLVQVLFDPNTVVEDSLTYDITAWSMPFAYGLEAYASEEKIEVEKGYSFKAYSNSISSNSAPYGYIASWESMHNAKFLASILREGIQIRYATNPFSINGNNYPAGTLVITSADNRKMGQRFHKIIAEQSAAFEQAIVPASSGLVASGSDFGSRDMQLISTPNVAVIAGDGTSTNSYGQVWFFMEQELQYPFDAISSNRLGSTDLSAYNVIIKPEGFYGLNQSTLSNLSDWVRGGGKLIAVGSSVRKLQDRQGFALTRYASESAKNDAERKQNQEELDNRFKEYGGSDRRSVSNYNPGSIFKLSLDVTHPLAYGIGEHYFTLKTNSLVYEPLTDAINIGLVDEELVSAGFMGYKLKEKVKNSVSFAVEPKGRGNVVYLVDNPLFRAFWENGKLLFSNALFLVE